MTNDELEKRLRAWYHSEIDEREPAPIDLRDGLAAIPATTRPMRRGFGGRRNVTLLAAAALLVAGGAAFAAGSGLLRSPSIVVLPSMPPTRVAVVPAPSTSTPSVSPSTAASPVPVNASPAQPGMFADETDLLPASDSVTWVSTHSGLYRTADSGKTWTDVLPHGWPSAAETALVDADTAYVASGGSPATIAATHDGGATWLMSSVDVGTNSGGPVFQFRTPLVGYASFFDPNGGSPWHVYATTDGGVTWTGPKDGTVPHMAASFDKLYPPIGGFLWQSAGKADNKPYDNRFFLSADGGVTWTRYTFPIGPLAPKDSLKEIRAIQLEDNGRILIVVDAADGRQAVYESGNDTATWRVVKLLPVSFDFQFVSPLEWVLFSPSSSELRTTVDGGAHWHITTSAMSTYDMFDHSFASATTGWATEECRYVPGSLCDGDRSSATQPSPYNHSKVLFVTLDGGATWAKVGD